MKQVADLPRVHLAQLPTPLEEASRLSDALGGPRILIKRDDLTGIGLGGNKVRKLEYVIGRAIAENADTLVVCGGFQSNLARIAAAMGCRLGLQVELLLGGIPGEKRELEGNLLLDQLYGANIHFVDTEPRWDFGTAVEDLAEALRKQGRKPYVVPLGASSPEGMAGYIEATEEMLDQFRQLSVKPDYLFVAIGSGGTYSGLMLGAMNLDAPYKVAGISVSRTREYLLDKLPGDMQVTASELGLGKVPREDDLLIFDDYIGGGYGEPTCGCSEAVTLMARTEGIILDPVYSGKCMHGLIDQIQKGIIGKDQTVVFLHTGGWPALFSYEAGELGLTGNAKLIAD